MSSFVGAEIKGFVCVFMCELRGQDQLHGFWWVVEIESVFCVRSCQPVCVDVQF